MRRSLIALLSLLMFAAGCSPDDGPQGITTAEPDPALVQHAVRLHVDLTRNTIEVVQPEGPAGAAASLLGHDAVSVITGAATTGDAHGSFRHVRFDVSVLNLLPGITLTTSTFPTPPRGASGIMLFPYSIEVTGGKGQVDASDEWDGAVHNFFDNRNCTSNVHCFRYEMFAGDLESGATTPAQQVGFIVHRNVQSFDVFMVVAADLVPGIVPNGSVAGSVTSPERGALAGAVVTLAPSGMSATTAADGTFLLPDVAPGAYVASVAGLPAYCSSAPPQAVTVQSGGQSSVAFSVTCTAPAGSVSGTVSSAFFGGIAATVSAGGISTRTDENGDYTLVGLPVGPQTVTVTDLPSQCSGASPAEVTVKDGGAAMGIDIAVVCSGSVTVQVTGTGRGPIANAVVQLVTDGPTLATDASGSVTFADVVEGQYIASVVQNPHGCTPAGTPFTVATQITAVAVELQCPAATGTIAGVVTSSFGPLSSVLVQVGAASTATAADGSYAMSGVPVGTRQVTIANVPAHCTAPASESVEVVEAQTTMADFDVACTGTVTVNVSAAARGVIAGAVVQLDDGGVTQTTDAAGNATFTGVSAGAHVARVLSTPFTCGTGTRSFTVTAPATSIAMTLDCAPATGSIGGTIMTNDGTPIPVPQVEVSVGQGSTMTLTNGTYALSQLPVGQVTITVNASRTRPCDPQQRTVTLTEGATLDVSFSLNCPAPVAEAGEHRTAMAGGNFALNGLGSRAHNNVPLTFSWQELGGSFAAASAIATVQAPEITRRIFRLTVSDGLRTDSDEIEVFVLEETTGIFVNPMFGDDGNSGTHHWEPLRTLEAALSRSIGLYKDIYITAGTFTAPQAMLSGVGSIYGGFVEADWTRGSARTVLTVGAKGVNITHSPGVVLDRLEIVGANASIAGESAYGLRLFFSVGARLTNSIVRAGSGAAGADGAAGDPGSDGVNGNPGQQGSTNGTGGAGGAGTVPTSCALTPCVGNAGGNGGRSGAGQDGLGNPMATTTQTAVPGGRGGAPGDPGQPGQPGNRGHDGDAGMDGLPAAATLSFSGGYHPGSGSDGLTGRDAHFGSGGGGGGSQVCLLTCALSTGSGGGSGGTGGKGGLGGRGGQGGGASIAIYLEDSAIDIAASTVIAANGGDGGNGGRGGAGGIGGQGGAGGAAPANAYGRGGNGGPGGTGGAGGNGASGNGGPAIAVVRVRSSAIVRGTTTLQTGTAGRGGTSLPAGQDGQAVTIYP